MTLKHRVGVAGACLFVACSLWWFVFNSETSYRSAQCAPAQDEETSSSQITLARSYRDHPIQFHHDHWSDLPAACLEESVRKMLKEERRRLLVTTDTEPSFWISVPPKKEDGLRWPLAEKGVCCGTELTALFKTILGGKGFKAGEEGKGIVVDVGTNVGWYSLFSMAMGYRVYSFEPNSRVLSRYCEGIYQNGFERQVKAFHMALGDVAKEKVVLSQPSNPGAGTLQTEKVPEGNVLYKEEVPLSTLSEVMGETDATLLKIDVEGFEYQVLKGALDWLRKAKVEYICLELSALDVERQGLQPLDLFTWMEDLNYKLITLTLKDDLRSPPKVVQDCKDGPGHQCDLCWHRLSSD